jgi:predicted DNA-binding protein (MmcQ/YjbR family)
MNHTEAVRQFCLALPHTTEGIQWANDLVFKVGGKMYAVMTLDAPHPVQISFKCEAEVFSELTEKEGVIPAPYLARASWVALHSFSVLTAAELKTYLTAAHAIVLAGLPKKTRAGLL